MVGPVQIVAACVDDTTTATAANTAPRRARANGESSSHEFIDDADKTPERGTCSRHAKFFDERVGHQTSQVHNCRIAVEREQTRSRNPHIHKFAAMPVRA